MFYFICSNRWWSSQPRSVPMRCCWFLKCDTRRRIVRKTKIVDNPFKANRCWIACELYRTRTKVIYLKLSREVWLLTALMLYCLPRTHPPFCESGNDPIELCVPENQFQLSQSRDHSRSDCYCFHHQIITPPGLGLVDLSVRSVIGVGLMCPLTATSAQ